MTTIYKVYNDEWFDIYGEGQLKQFVLESVLDLDAEEKQAHMVTYVLDNNIKDVKNILQTLNEDSKLTIDQATLLLEFLGYEYDEVEVY